MLERMLNAQSSYAQVDENGRLVLSVKLKEMIEVSSEALFIGMGDKFQIWEPEAYNVDMHEIEREFDSYDESNNPFTLLQSNFTQVG